MTHGLYLYGILPEQLNGDRTVLNTLQGLDQQPIETKEFAGLTLLYSAAKHSKYLASRRNLLGHERVLESAMTAGYRNLLPLRFGLTVTDWETVEAELFVPYQDVMRSLLSKLDGYREVSVKIFWNPESELQQMMLENKELADERDRHQGQAMGMDTVIKLGQAIERAMVERRNAIVNEFRQKLSRLSIEQIENDGLDETMIYNAAFLISWDTEELFSQYVEVLDAQFPDRFKIRYNNFTAPYNFAQLN